MPEKILGSELSEDAFELLNKRYTVAIVATVDEDGYPRTMLAAAIGAPDKKTIRVGVQSHRYTYRNMIRDGKVMICVVEKPNIAIGIKGKAQIVSGSIDPRIKGSTFEVKIEEVKSDAGKDMPITSGIRHAYTEETAKIVTAEFWIKLWKVLRGIELSRSDLKEFFSDFSDFDWSE